MQQLLVDELTGDHVILAPARALRPDTFRVHSAPLPAAVDSCPFCAGNETETPPEVARTGDGAPDTPGWRVRVVPNKYPIVGRAVPGAHEVVILSPAHDRDFGALTETAAAEALLTVRDRTRALLAQGFVHTQAFVNHGKAAGASIEHPHAQVVALDFVPPGVQARLDRFTPERFTHDQHDRFVNGEVVAWCPRASTTPFAARIAARAGGNRFDTAPEDTITAVAVTLRDTLARIHGVLGEIAYNVVIETAPRDHDRQFHWWVDVVPRVTVMAGFELGTGVWVNIVAPADAAAALRAGR